MTRRPSFLSVDEVVEIHRRQLEVFGGAPGIRDRAGLESALAQPRATFGGTFLHSDLYSMAAAYIFHIAQNQPFVDGNKRAALVAGIVFLGLNRCFLADPDGRLYAALIDVAEHRIDKVGLASLLKSLSV